MISTLIPARSKSFSLKRTVLKAAGRAPLIPSRACFSPLTTRQVATKLRRSLRKLSLSRSTVCSVVSEYLMPNCLRLLHADILPQNESRRCWIVIKSTSSGVACTSTGTFSSAQRSALAIGPSSPKLGSVMTTPMMSSRWARKRSAHLRAAAKSSTVPKGESSGERRIGLRPSSSKTLRKRAPFLAKFRGEESPVADDNAYCGFFHNVYLAFL